MERDKGPSRTSPGITPDGASGLLNDLAVDRAVLADRLTAPWWLYPAFGVIAAVYVASPLIETDLLRRIITGIAIASTIVLVASFQRITGVKVARAGAPARLTLILLLLAVLLLLSTSFGLASFGLYGWIVIPAAASFGLTVVLGKLFDSQVRDKVRRGR